MRVGLLLAVAGLWAAGAGWSAAAQSTGACACGAHPPGPPKDRTVEPYAGEPADMSPWGKFAKPYYLNYVHPNIYSGAGRELPIRRM